MRGFIGQVLVTWEVQGDKRVELVLAGDDANYFEAHKALDPYPRPLKYAKHTLKAKDGRRVDVVLDNSPSLLPDRTGVLVVFSVDAPRAGASFFFPPPHNAAIINADGTLRFQLKNPVGPDGVFGPVVSLSGPDGPRLGVRACPKNYPAYESVYVVDGTTDDLSKRLPVWVRD